MHPGGALTFCLSANQKLEQPFTTRNCRRAFTMQDRAMALMGKKLTVVQAVEGRFSSEGLVALAGEDANIEIALARSLVECMDEGHDRRHWSKALNPAKDAEVAGPGEQPIRSLGPRLWVEAAELLPTAARAGTNPRRRAKHRSDPGDGLIGRPPDLLF